LGKQLLNPSYRWVIFIVIVSGTAVGMMAWAAVFPLLTLWVRDLGISHTQGGILFALYYIPGILVCLPGGWLFDRFPVKRVLLISWTLLLSGAAVMALAPSFLVLCAGRLLLSIGLNVHHVGAPKLLSGWFDGRKELGLVMGLYTWAYTIGIFTSLALLGKVGETRGWHAAMYVVVVATAVALAALALLLRPAPQARAGQQEETLPFQPWKLGLGLWLVALMYLFYNAGSDSYYTFTPDYLVRRGYGIAYASYLVGTYAWIAFFLKPIFASFLNRRTAPYFVAVGSSANIASFILLLQPVIHPYLISTLVGFSIAFTMPSLLALPAFLVENAQRGQAYGLCQLFYSLGFFAQPLIGFSIDRTGQYYWAYFLMSAYCGIALLSALGLRFLNSRELRPAIVAAGN
jgi:MFS family permease